MMKATKLDKQETERLVELQSEAEKKVELAIRYARAERQRAYYEAHKEQIAAYQKAYRKKNKEKVAAYQLKYRAMLAGLTVEEYVAMQKEKRKAHAGGKSKEEIAAYRKAYYEKNREKIAAKRKASRERKKAKEAAAVTAA